jgi:flagellar biosynthesis protein FlhF
MATQTFRGKSSEEAINAVRKRLGDDAIIVTTKTVRNPNGVTETIIEAASPKGGLPPKKSLKRSRAPQIILNFDRLLEMSGLSIENRKWLLDNYCKTMRQDKTIDLSALAQLVSSKLSFENPIQERSRVRMLLGPTGVGKTTTIAKLCGQLIQSGANSIGLVTVDTHRVGGAEQLAGFAKLFRVPMTAAATPTEFKEALYKLRSKEHVLIDTAGCGAKETAKLEELNHLLADTEDIERTLLLPASGNTQDLQRMHKAFSNIGLSSIGITKTDETCYFGPCVNVLLQIGLPLSLLGTGQQIPDDLTPATAGRIISLLIKATHQ